MKCFLLVICVAASTAGFAQSFSGVSGSYTITNEWSVFNPGYQGSGTDVTSGSFGSEPVQISAGQYTWFRSQLSYSRYDLDVQTYSSYWNDGAGGNSMSSDRRRSTFWGSLEIAREGNYTITAIIDGTTEVGPAQVAWQGLGLDETLMVTTDSPTTRTFTAFLTAGSLNFEGLTTTGMVSGGNSSASGMHRIRFSVQAVPEPTSFAAIVIGMGSLRLRRGQSSVRSLFTSPQPE